MSNIEKIRTEIERRKKENMFVDLPMSIGRYYEDRDLLTFIDSLQQEQQGADLEKFTEKMDAWKARYNYPDNIPINATMAFTARMFYMYPNVAREWYDSLPKATQD